MPCCTNLTSISKVEQQGCALVLCTHYTSKQIYFLVSTREAQCANRGYLQDEKERIHTESHNPDQQKGDRKALDNNTEVDGDENNNNSRKRKLQTMTTHNKVGVHIIDCAYEFYDVKFHLVFRG
jgi:hypothetical protein